MKIFHMFITTLLVFSLLSAACSIGAIATETPTAVPLGTFTPEVTISPETETPEMTKTETPEITETETPEADETETPAATSAPLTTVTLNVSQNATLGSFLVDDRCFTLYLFAQDTMNTSTCTGDCATEWPPLLIANTLSITASSGVDVLKLGTAMRADGSLQATYNGWPLYYFDEDQQPGDVNGQGQDDFFVISPACDKVSK